LLFSARALRLFRDRYEDSATEHAIKLSYISVGQMAKFFFDCAIFGALLCAWNVFFAGRLARTLCGSHRDTLALPDSQG